MYMFVHTHCTKCLRTFHAMAMLLEELRALATHMVLVLIAYDLLS